jgi:hypothetical protein
LFIVYKNSPLGYTKLIYISTHQEQALQLQLQIKLQQTTVVYDRHINFLIVEEDSKNI